jgi:tetratricopeptide (TPR) repeat protein
LGAAYLRLGDEEHAETAFRHAARLNPQDVNALYNLGAMLNASHKYTEARPILERAFRQERSIAIGYEVAVAAAGTGDRKAALKVLNSMDPPSDRNAAPWLKLKGTVNLDEGNLEAAAKALERAADWAPDDEETLYALALVRLRANQADQALALLDRKFASLAPSLRHLREGTLMASFGAYKQALTLFEQATAEDPTSYDAFYNLAVVRLESSKDADGALDSAQRALALKSTGEVHDLLGDIYETQGHYDVALRQYQEAVRLDPENDKFVFDLGAELILHENYDTAQTIFRLGEERFPRSSRIYLGLGAAEFMGGKTTDSVDAFLKAVDLNPESEPAYAFLGEAFSFAGARSAEVLVRLAHAAGQKPQSFGVQYYYGATLVAEMASDGDLAKADPALAALRRAAALRPQDARVYYQFGEICRLQKKTTEAIAYYEKSASLDPDFPDPLYKLGQAYIRAGKPEDAKRTFARHKEVMTKEQAVLDRRFGDIRSFVLEMKSAQ